MFKSVVIKVLAITKCAEKGQSNYVEWTGDRLLWQIFHFNIRPLCFFTRLLLENTLKLAANHL